MGDYSYSEHLEMFGGPPEPGEAYPDLEQVDALRKAAKEDPPVEHPHAREMRLQLEAAARELEHPPEGWRDA